MRSYPAGVPAEVHVPRVPVTRLLDDATASFPTRTALTYLGTTMTYRGLRDVADHLAAGLAGLGVRSGSRVLVVLPNCPQHVLTVFAVLRLGAVVVPVDPSLGPEGLRARLHDSGARVAVCLDQAHRTLQRVRGGTALEHVVVTSLADYLPTLRRLRLRLPPAGSRRNRARRVAPLPRGADVLSFVRLVRTRRGARQTPVDPQDDLALLQYTDESGELLVTGVTHENLVSTAYLDRAWDVGGRPGEDVVLGALPLATVHGLAAGLLASVLLAGKLVLLPDATAPQVLAAVSRWEVSVLPATPSLIADLVAAAGPTAQATGHDLTWLRLCRADGAVDASVRDRFSRLSAGELLEGYGLARGRPSTHRDPRSGSHPPGSIGLPLPGTSCTVVEPDGERPVAVGETGELVVAGPQVFGGASGGGLRTGELVCMDEDGFFVLVGGSGGAGSECGARWKSEPPAGRSDLV